MNIYTVNYILSRLSFAMTAALVIPLILAIVGNEPSREAFMLSVLVSGFLGVGFRRYGKPAEELTAREGIAITAFGWFTGTFLGMLPYLLGDYLGFLDALFESISGFTGLFLPRTSPLQYSLLADDDGVDRRAWHHRHFYRAPATVRCKYDLYV